ncbi:phage baseplate protein [Pseudomonas viridiflava]|uniref:phage baseplate protein n=1 Tax=Pseudomonas viridiflava TaxID=33069 RepID=UPI002EC998B4|nr:hypothetical protein [Pseudomonas viridiflava]
MDANFSGYVIVTKTKDVIYFDAITRIQESYTSSISKHPLSDGSLITDHTTRENPKYSISGVLSDADFNLQRPSNLSSLPNQTLNSGEYVGTDFYDVRDKQFTNNTQVVYPVQITEKSTINRLLPEVIAQFTKDTIPDAFVTPQDKVKTARGVKSQLVEMWRTADQFQVVEILAGTTIGVFGPCVFTNLVFEENTDTGEGIFPEMVFEEVKYATTKSVSVTINKGINKGRVSGKATTKPGRDEVANAPSSYTDKSVLDYVKPQQ